MNHETSNTTNSPAVISRCSHQFHRTTSDSCGNDKALHLVIHSTVYIATQYTPLKLNSKHTLIFIGDYLQGTIEVH